MLGGFQTLQIKGITVQSTSCCKKKNASINSCKYIDSPNPFHRGMCKRNVHCIVYNLKYIYFCVTFIAKHICSMKAYNIISKFFKCIQECLLIFFFLSLFNIFYLEIFMFTFFCSCVGGVVFF